MNINEHLKNSWELSQNILFKIVRFFLYICIYKNIICVCRCVCMSLCVYVYMYIYVCICVLCVCMLVCVYLCKCVCVCTFLNLIFFPYTNLYFLTPPHHGGPPQKKNPVCCLPAQRASWPGAHKTRSPGTHWWGVLQGGGEVGVGVCGWV